MILLEALGVAEVTLCVTYVVSKASWSPKYDVRVYSAEHQLKVCIISVNLYWYICSIYIACIIIYYYDLYYAVNFKLSGLIMI